MYDNKQSMTSHAAKIKLNCTSKNKDFYTKFFVYFDGKLEA